MEGRTSFYLFFLENGRAIKQKEKKMLKKNDIVEVEIVDLTHEGAGVAKVCLLYTSPSPRDTR